MRAGAGVAPGVADGVVVGVAVAPEVGVGVLVVPALGVAVGPRCMELLLLPQALIRLMKASTAKNLMFILSPPRVLTLA